MLSVARLPLMESSVGQFCSQGPIHMWKAVPILQGVGITMMLVSTFMSKYYNFIIAYSICYMFASFQFLLPWSECSSWSFLSGQFTRSLLQHAAHWIIRSGHRSGMVYDCLPPYVDPSCGCLEDNESQGKLVAGRTHYCQNHVKHYY
ncbi:Sodium- and chloride-dependent neutral and basic amino acid transporter B(0+) [Bagarius yarrelli]|uniref:Sodium-and chloride-dependent neutral and basic amino acid transporter B(0+) n=1 Tax=Bagarius yarrelli TaxID=175774 RepID=A0A556V8Z9_BAGYA|nr:Sodium- and chloride-dependent neutral and basic amino acid transporter B(0+) [Bagarius yarrelli]